MDARKSHHTLPGLFKIHNGLCQRRCCISRAGQDMIDPLDVAWRQMGKLGDRLQDFLVAKEISLIQGE